METRSMRKRGRDVFMDGAICEGADYLIDMETSNDIRNKRARSFSEHLCGIEKGRGDENYISFLFGLEEYWKAKFVEEDDEEDPSYAMFLENLKEHGNAYMLDVSVEHGVCSPILYEIETSPLDEMKRKTPKLHRVKCTTDRETRSLDVNDQLEVVSLNSGLPNGRADESKRRTLRSDTSTRIQEDRMCSMDGDFISGRNNYGFEKERANSVNHNIPDEINRKAPRFRQGTYTWEDVDRELKSDPKCNSVEADETYNSFLTRLKVIGDVVCYEYGDQKQILYEVIDQQMSVDVGIEPPETAPRPSAPFTTAPTTSPAPPPRPSMAPVTTLRQSNHRSHAPFTTPRSPSCTPAPLALPSTAPPTSLAPSTTSTLPTPPSKAGESSPRPPNSRSTAPATTLRPSKYPSAPITSIKSPTPLKALITAPRSPTWTSAPQNLPSTALITTPTSRTPTSKPSATYLRPPIHPSASPITTPRPPTPANRVPNTTPKSLTLKNHQTMLTIYDKTSYSGGQMYSFWEKLYKVLRQPYDQTEYDDLWKFVSTRKPVLHYRDSRSGGYYKPGQMGQSYLDRFPDLNSEIEKVKSDPRKVLNLLRMLSYYLQKLAMGRIPKPWTDDYSKTILPGST